MKIFVTPKLPWRGRRSRHGPIPGNAPCNEFRAWVFFVKTCSGVGPLSRYFPDGTIIMRQITTILFATTVFGLAATLATAQSTGPMKGMDGGSMAGMSASDMKGMGNQNMMAMNANMAAMRKMHTAMMNAKGSSADVTFARKMLAHHQGAIDMAQIEIKYGADAEAKRMAKQMIAEQSKSKTELQAWLAAHGG